jgi:hypothetical protein
MSRSFRPNSCGSSLPGRKPDLPVYDKPGLDSKQRGFALFAVLIILFIVITTGSIVHRTVVYDIRHTGRNLARVKANYLAEAAVFWGMAMAERDHFMTFFTHDTTGDQSLLADTCHSGFPDSCGHFDLGADNNIYPTGSIELDSSYSNPDFNYWLLTKPGHDSESLSGDVNEIVTFKSWISLDDTVHIIGKGITQGCTSRVEIVGTF